MTGSELVNNMYLFFFDLVSASMPFFVLFLGLFIFLFAWKLGLKPFVRAIKKISQ